MGDSRLTSRKKRPTHFPPPLQSTRDDRGNYGSGMTESCLHLTLVDLEKGGFSALDVGLRSLDRGGMLGVCFYFLVIHLI